MRCQDIELLIIASSERSLSQEELFSQEQHTAQCAQCRRFQADWENIRQTLKEPPVPVLSSELEDRTRLLCHEAIKTRPAVVKTSVSRTSVFSLPKSVRAAIISTVILTIVTLILFFLNYSVSDPLKIETAAILTLILQNSVTLIFAPVVIRRYRRQKLNMRFV